MNFRSTISKAAKSARTYFRLFGLRGVIKRALINTSGGDNEFKATIPGSAKTILLRLGTTDVAAFEHVFVNDEYGFSLSQPPTVIIDAGANVGMSAVYFAQRYPTAKIIAIEPEPSNFAILRKNADLFPRIIPINAALWSHDNGVRMNDVGGGHWAMQVADSSSSFLGLTKSVTLKGLLRQLGIEHADLLKLDVEGAEREILQDSLDWITRVSVICAELHDRFRPGCSTAYNLATAEFPIRWRRGELHCVAREGMIAEQ